MASYHTEKLNRQKNLLEQDRPSDAYSSADVEAIEDFMRYDEGENKDGTVASHIGNLRNVAIRADFDLTDVDGADRLVDELKEFKSGDHPDVKDEGIIVNNYVSALRVFYRYHDDLGIDPRDIDVDEDYSGRDLSPEDLLYKDGIDDYLAAAQRASVRDMAFIALTLATGQRVDAVRTLRLKHVRVDGPTMEIRLNEDEGDLKGAKGAKPLLWAKHYVRPWYESHPHDDPEAALFPATENDPTAGDSGTWKTDPMSQSQTRYIVRERAKDAGIEKNVYPHLLRHCAITRMAAQGDLSEQQIKNIVGWGGDSSQFDTYVTLAEEIATDSIRSSLGLPTSESGAPVVGRPSLDTCPNCGDQLPDGSERCRTCNTAMTQAEARKDPDEGRDSVSQILDIFEDESDAAIGRALREHFEEKGEA